MSYVVRMRQPRLGRRCSGTQPPPLPGQQVCICWQKGFPTPAYDTLAGPSPSWLPPAGAATRPPGQDGILTRLRSGRSGLPDAFRVRGPGRAPYARLARRRRRAPSPATPVPSRAMLTQGMPLCPGGSRWPRGSAPSRPPRWDACQAMRAPLLWLPRPCRRCTHRS